ncbi:RNA-directed DNA polymerase, eukaryota [Tanacetum coccineum]
MVSFVTSTNQTKWLQNVLVSEATSIHSLLDLQSLFRSFDVNDCTVKHLGGLRCMLDFENKQDASDFLLNRKDCWLNWFKWLQPWTSELKTEDIITWLRIEGLPIHVWYSKAFSQIASVWGTVLIPDECETNDPNFVYGKVCIITREMHHLNKVIDIKVDGSVTKIRVSESIKDLDSLFGFKKPHMVIKDDLIFNDSVPSWVDDHRNDLVGEIKPVDGSLEGTPVVSNEIPAKRIIDSDKRCVYSNTTIRQRGFAVKETGQ